MLLEHLRTEAAGYTNVSHVASLKRTHYPGRAESAGRHSSPSKCRAEQAGGPPSGRSPALHTRQAVSGCSQGPGEMISRRLPWCHVGCFARIQGRAWYASGGCASIYGRAGAKAAHAGASQCRAAHSLGEHARYSRNELMEKLPEHCHVRFRHWRARGTPAYRISGSGRAGVLRCTEEETCLAFPALQRHARGRSERLKRLLGLQGQTRVKNV